MVSVGISSGGIHFSLQLRKSVADKMAEIESRNPQEWEGRGIDLMKEAQKELDAEQQSQPER